MDILSILREGVDKLPEGEHLGLKAVINHIEVAIRHLHVGQSDGDDQLFTDAVYRCNQAFEGSVKELYRVVAGKDGSSTTPHNIEEFLEKSKTLRPKVLMQLKRYRQEWRNPSTHDYTLDFDSDEAFLAIVNIAAFAQTAVSQIASKLAFDLASQSEIKPPPLIKNKEPAKSSSFKLIDEVGVYSGVYLAEATLGQNDDRKIPEGQVASMLAGFLSSLEHIEVELESKITPDRRLYADIMVKRGKEKCVVELRSELALKYNSKRGIEQLLSYMEAGDIKNGVLAIYGKGPQVYSTLTTSVSDNRSIQVVLPRTLADEVSNRWTDYEFEPYHLVD